jgi:thiol-disulfide isomerase/thioredoxin
MLACFSTDGLDAGTGDLVPVDTGSTSEDTGGSFEPEATIPAIRVDTEVTWTLTFDEEAQELGYEECSYSRTYEGLQFIDMDYLCPACDILVTGTAVMTEGFDCYSQISSDPQEERTEVWGLDLDGSLYRTSLEQLALGELTEFEDAGEGQVADIGWDAEYELTDGGMMGLVAEGELTWETDEATLLVDPWMERTEDYACGWPQDNPGTLELDYALAEGGTFPRVRLDDQCGDALDLWDLYGRWLVLDSSQPDCGPCQSMAASAEEFVAEMADEGIEVVVVSFLGAGLSAPYATPDEETHDSWVESFELTDPVLYDRGFTYALFPEFFESWSGEDFGYPAWIIVDPEMTLVFGNIGFSSWDDVAEVIRELER